MRAQIEIARKSYIVDLNKPFDISLPLRKGLNNPRAWYVPPVKMEPVVADGFIGSVAKGGSVNFRNIFFNPHGHGTHTESYGHVTPQIYSVNIALKKFFFLSQVISVKPQLASKKEKLGIEKGDLVIQLKDIQSEWNKNAEAIIIRTLPNLKGKKVKNYSNTNPPYLHPRLAKWMNEKDIKHLLVDLPSVDREQDGGKLRFHNAFWGVYKKLRKNATITEFIFVPDKIKDGIYLLNLQIAPFDNDASPSKPVLYKLKQL